MRTGRLQAFSDGVFAIAITITVLELKVPHGDTPAALRPLAGYAAAVGPAFVRPWLADAVYVAVAALWPVPDRRIERELAGRSGTMTRYDA